jgi:hypothetical protein
MAFRPVEERKRLKLTLAAGGSKVFWEPWGE